MQKYLFIIIPAFLFSYISIGFSQISSEKTSTGKLFLGDSIGVDQIDFDEKYFNDYLFESYSLEFSSPKRKIYKKDWYSISNYKIKPGKISIKTCINQAGIVTYSEILNNETTVKELATLEAFLRRTNNFDYELNEKAPKIQCGKTIINLNLISQYDSGEGSSPFAGSGTGNNSDGQGEYDNTGNVIFGRKIISNTSSLVPKTNTGRVTIKVCINQAGLVTYTEVMSPETTIKDTIILKQCLKLAKAYKFEANNKAPKEQCGKIFFDLKAE